MTAIDIDLGTSASIVTVDFKNGSASVVQPTASLAPQAPPPVQNRAEAVIDVSSAAQDVVAVYSDALKRLADH